MISLLPLLTRLPTTSGELYIHRLREVGESTQKRVIKKLLYFYLLPSKPNKHLDLTN